MKKSTRVKCMIGYKVGCMILDAVVMVTCLSLAVVVAVRG